MPFLPAPDTNFRSMSLPKKAQPQNEHRISLIDVFETMVAALIGVYDELAEYSHAESPVKST